jgi:hypothetical protein
MTTHELPIHGTVYGVLLNSNAEWQSASPHMTEALGLVHVWAGALPFGV